jgi:hypothetical protein
MKLVALCATLALLALCTRGDSRSMADSASTVTSAAIARGSSILKRVGRAVAERAVPSTQRHAVMLPPDTASPSDIEAALWTGHSAISPHFPHATFAYTDFYYSYHPQKTLPTLARRYDLVMSGPGDQWKRLDSTVTLTRYRLFWTVLQPDKTTNEYTTLTAWYARHPQFKLEDAFLHKPGTTPTPANRLTKHIWDSNRWLYNPADSGLRMYEREAVGRVIEAGNNGVFYDEFGRGSMAGAFKSLELDSLQYQRATVEKLAGLRATFPKALIKVNTGAYTTPFDSAVIVAAGGVQLETLNDPLTANLNYTWKWIDHLLAANVKHIELVSLRAWTDKLPNTLTAGNEDSPIHRVRMGDYASYLLVRPTDPRILSWNQDNTWREDPATHWLKAFEANIGQPAALRSPLASGKDSLGQAYTVWQRPYTRALVLLRAVNGWDKQDYGDRSAIAVTLPKAMRRLNGNGSLAEPSKQVTLRAGEGAILIP